MVLNLWKTFFITQAVKAAGNLLKNANLSADAIKAGKNQLKLQVLSEAENGTSLAESIATQGLYTGAVKSPAEVAKDIDQLSNNDISQVNFHVTLQSLLTFNKKKLFSSHQIL